MKLQNLTVIFIIIILPIILMVSLYINTGIKTIKYQALYDTALLNATHDAIYAFEQNTANNKYSDNAETKRSIIKSSVKMFETSLANSAGISAYSSDEIEEYIPAILFGMYDGFYLYAPSYNTQSGKYEHDLKNYVYYSETLSDGTIIRYSLDNYVSVTVKDDNTGEYIIKEGYLSIIDNEKGIQIAGSLVKYKGLLIDFEALTDDNTLLNNDAKKYFKSSYEFSKWFLEEVDLDSEATYLKIGETINGVLNDPEDPNSAFSQHRRKIMKEKIENVLNSTITAYSQRTWTQNYKMPKLSEEDWEKIYDNISVTSFFQGKKIGLTKYNGYCVLNSTNHTEYVNPNLLYFIDRTTIGSTTKYYHDIRCAECANETGLLDYIVRPKGYRIGSFNGRKVTETDESGNTITKYVYDHKELACYNCINGIALSTSESIYDYVNGLDNLNGKKRAYWTSLARERYNTTKLTALSERPTVTVTFETNGGSTISPQTVHIGTKAIEPTPPTKTDYAFGGWYTDAELTTKYTFNEVVTSDITLYAKWKEYYTVTYRVAESGAHAGYIFKTDKVIEENNLKVISDTPSHPTNESYVFANKWEDRNTGAIYESGGEYEIEGDLTLQAKWEISEKCIVKYYNKYNTVIRTDEHVKGSDHIIASVPDVGDYFVGWQDGDYEDKQYLPGDRITDINRDVHLYPIIVKMPDLKITGGTGATVTLVGGKYTNEGTIRLQPNCTSEELNYIEFFVDGVNQNSKIKEYTTNSDNVQEIDIKYKFIIRNLNGEVVAESPEQEKYILVDRKGPTIDYIRNGDYIYWKIKDEGCGSIKSIDIKWLNKSYKDEIETDTYQIGGNYYSYRYKLKAYVVVGNRKIIAEDKLRKYHNGNILELNL